jgi:hypothetical protein
MPSGLVNSADKDRTIGRENVMKLRTSVFRGALTGLVMLPVSMGFADPCPKGRSLDQQIKQADVIVLGHVERAGKCPPPLPDGSDICHGHEATVTIQKVWKGFPKVGHRLNLSMLPKRPRVQVEAGQTVVLFADILAEGTETFWYVESDAGMYPDGLRPTSRQLVHQLDEYFAKQ